MGLFIQIAIKIRLICWSAGLLVLFIFSHPELKGRDGYALIHTPAIRCALSQLAYSLDKFTSYPQRAVFV